jgi:hypothetical protein
MIDRRESKSAITGRLDAMLVSKQAFGTRDKKLPKLLCQRRHRS